MRHPFEKWHGLGNDFIVADDVPGVDWGATARRLCDRHRGVGADGILVVGARSDSMSVFNADGSTSEMCGNGLRCVAAALTRRGVSSPLTIATGAGPLRCAVASGGPHTWVVDVAAGRVSFDPRLAGVDVDGAELWLEAEGRRGLVASIGNPHWVFFEHGGRAELERVGATLEHDPRFLHRTNIEFVAPLGGARWRVDVWERGCGLTEACGTGATAVAAALVRTGRAPPGARLEIELPGGTLEISAGAHGDAEVRGPATVVFEGTVSLSLG